MDLLIKRKYPRSIMTFSRTKSRSAIEYCTNRNHIGLISVNIKYFKTKPNIVLIKYIITSKLIDTCTTMDDLTLISAIVRFIEQCYVLFNYVFFVAKRK